MVAPALADWARSGEQLLSTSLAHPGALTLLLVFAGGLLTSLGPCSLSLLPEWAKLTKHCAFSAKSHPETANPARRILVVGHVFTQRPS